MKIAIVGGGIGGMATALALLNRGFKVQVYEQANELREIGAGVQISPNGCRALNSLGILKTLQSLSFAPESKVIRHWQTGRSWKLLELGGSAKEKFGFPFLTVFRPDLLKVLTEAVVQQQADAIHLQAKCIGISVEANTAKITLSSGLEISADLVIGADGVHSAVRSSLYDQKEPTFTGLAAFRSLIPIEKIPKKIATMIGSNWVGPGGHIVHYPLQGGKVMNLVCTHEIGKWTHPEWKAKASIEECHEYFHDWHEEVKTLIELAPSFSKWALISKSFLPSWTRGCVTLLGDACHPTLPSFAQGAVMAIEDGIVLARCLVSRNSIAEALQSYEHLRLNRTYDIVRRADDFMPNFNHPCLKDPIESNNFISTVWSPEAIRERYDWMFNYDVETVKI